MLPERASGQPRGAEPLIPILSVDDGLGDPVALATWYEALSNAIGVDVPHDLLGLWLFPAHGSAVLLGPAALAEDQLAIPTPLPYLHAAELAAVEEVVRRAGYASVTALPIRFGRRDVGLLLAADLRPERFKDTERALLQWATQRLAPTLGRLARLWGTADVAPHGIRFTPLLEALGEVVLESKSPRRFAYALSHALEPVIPHDHLELLVPDSTGDRWVRLGEHAGGKLWADPALIVERTSLDVGALFGDRERLIVADTYGDRRWPRGYLTAAEPAGADLRALVGTRLAGAAGPLAYLLLGSVGPDFYREDDAVLLAQIAGVLRARMESFIVAAPPLPSATTPVSPGERTVARHPVAAIAALLATTSDPTQALAAVAEEARLLLPVRSVQYVLRLIDGDRVVVVEPGERRPLADLPLVPIAGGALARVVHGEVGHVLEVAMGESRLIVPLRVGDRISGAVVLTAPAAGFDDVMIGLAQQFADVVAPHLELLRRAALPPPYIPGWKRSTR